jgi:hypothetical protein
MIQPRSSQAFPKSAERVIQSHRTFEGSRGPWGRFQYRRIAISRPDEYSGYEPVGGPIRWWFEGFSRDRVESLFRDAGLTPEQLV